MSEAHCNNIPQRKALGLVTHDNTGGPFVVECQGCGGVYPSFQCLGGGQIADTGDYEDARCPHCDQVDPEECDNAALAWNTQQLKINELQQRLNAADQRIDEMQASLKDLISAVRSINRSPAYRVTVIGDDEPQYRQRKEWIDWVLELCDKAAAGNEQPATAVVVPPFAEQVIRKLQRFQECAEDGQDADISRQWFDLLTRLGLLNRVQRSPAIWEISQQGEDCLKAAGPIKPSL